jgi:hypothetical protein
VASVLGAEVIVLESHPVWVSAQRRARERTQAMHRHPSSLSKPDEVNTREAPCPRSPGGFARR